MTNLLALSAGTELVGDFKIKKVLGAGGFGITYLAEELALARQVTIKEYFPADFAARDKGRDAKARSRDCAADYKWGLERFIEEAQTLARFDHPNIVRVYRYFRANNTGYMVLQFEEGKSLKGWLKGLGRAPRQTELDELLGPLLDALEIIHGRDFLHRDIAPDNIMVRKDKSPVLIDFGSARGEIVSHSRTVSALVKPGYSPYEQYASTTRQQGPWTDIYALGATFYQAITGKRPPDAPSRMINDEYIPARAAAIGNYRAEFLSAIDRSLRLEIGERPQNIAVWRGELLGDARAPVVASPRTTRAKLGGLLGLSRGGGAEAASVPPNAETSMPPEVGSVLPAPKAAEVLPPVHSRKATRKTPAAPPKAPADDSEKLLDAGAAATRFGLGYGPMPAGSDEAADSGARTQFAPGAGPAAVVVSGSGINAVARGAEPFEHAPVRKGGRSAPQVFVASELTLNGPMHAPVERRHPTKLRKRWFFLRKPWRGLIVKFAIGVAVASLLVAYQNELRQESAALTTRSPSLSSASLPAPAEKIAGRLPSTGGTELKQSGTLGQHLGAVKALALAGQGGRLVSVGADGFLRVWDIKGQALVRAIALPDGAALAVAADEGLALTAHGDGTLALWDIAAGQRLSSYKTTGGAVGAVVLLDKGARFASGAGDGRIALWERQALSGPVAVVEAHDSAVLALANVEGRDAVLSAATESAFKMLSAKALQPVRTYRGHKADVSALDGAASGAMVVSGDADGQVRAWSGASRRLIKRFKAHDGGVTALRLSSKADVLASAGQDGQIKIWDGRRGLVLASASVAGGPVRGAVFVDGGRRLLTGGDDGQIRIWDTNALSSASE